VVDGPQYRELAGNSLAKSYDRAMPLRIGETFAGYRILKLLGSGGMGEVYLARHPRLPRHDALKVLREDISSDSSFRERFTREADLAAGLRHPHVVGIHDRGEEDGQLWIAMDYVEGTDAAHLMQQRYPAGMPAELVVAIIEAVASALDYAHRKGLLHRDVKPANIIIADTSGDDSSIFLADFGIARPLDDTSGLTTTNMTVGTVAYAAPEQLLGDAIDGRADEYALAATAYHLLTGAQLFPHSNPAVVISRHLNAPTPALADQRPELGSADPVLAAALAKDPNDRFACCTDFAHALAETVMPQANRFGAAPTARAAVRRTEPPASPARAETAAAGRDSERSARRRLIGVCAIAAVLLLGVIGLLWRPWEHRQTDAPIAGPITTSTMPIPAPMTPTTAPPAPAPPTVTVTAAPTTTTSEVPAGPSVGDECDDWMKVSKDAATGQEMICSGYPDERPKMTWVSTQASLVATLAAAPRTGSKTGSRCSEPPYTFGRSSDGYIVWCYSGERALMPGLKWLSTPDRRSVWALYSP